MPIQMPQKQVFRVRLHPECPGEAQGCLCQSHLDLMGNAGGYRPRDTMIARTLAVVTNRIPLNALVGRLGSDSSGDFLAEHERDSGSRLAESLQEAVQQLRLEHGNGGV